LFAFSQRGPVGLADSHISRHFRPCQHKLIEEWSSSEAGAIETVDQPTSLLKLNREEVGGTDADCPSLACRRCRCRMTDLVAPEVETTFVRLAPEEVEIMLSCKIFRCVDRVATSTVSRVALNNASVLFANKENELLSGLK